MRLSEAIRLGSLAIRPVAGRVFDCDREAGCAIGMGMLAAGYQHKGDPRWIENFWPWLYERTPQRWLYITLLTRLFDHQVMRGTLTIEQLCDQVRAWEDELEAKGINVEQVTMVATPGTTSETAAEKTEKVSA